MVASVIAYDRELPEIPGRQPWTRPDRYLVRDEAAPGRWRVETAGRRPSGLLLVEKLRQAVDEWRANGYPGASEVTRTLFHYWFEEDHDVPGFPGAFRYYFCQREAIETLAYVVEVFGKADSKPLIQQFAQIRQADLVSKSVEFQTTRDGQRQIRRFVAEASGVGVQDLPPKDLRRYAFKMATGSGKTWVMAMAVVWSYFHRKRVKGSPLATNFLIVAPNVIVYQRLEKDFEGGRIFDQIPLVPREWRNAFQLTPILRGDATEPSAAGNLFVSNIQQLYEARDGDWTPENAVQAILGPKPAGDLAAGRSMLERVKSVHELVVMNDEAHHVHDDELAWSQSLLSAHESLPRGLSLWLDFSATPRDQSGMYYPWTICDYPLAQAVEDRIVKAPIIVTRENDARLPKREPETVTKDNVADKYRYWIEAAVGRLRDHERAYKKLATKPVLFVMMEKSVFADAVGEYLWKTKELGFKESEVLVIHTDTKGNITQKDLDLARTAARDVDQPGSRIKAIVSVMMLKEGWDVRNVTVVLGLRPFTAKAEILPEQVVGRGLRLVPGVGPDRTQTLEVLGTRKLLDFLREELEREGVGVGVSKGDPQQAVTVYALQERSAYDIAIPLTKPFLTHRPEKLAKIEVGALKPIFDEEDLDRPYRDRLRLEFAVTVTEVHSEDLAAADLPSSQEVLGLIASKTCDRARLASAFAEVYPLVRAYVRKRCFGKKVDPEDESVRSHLRRTDIQDAIAKYLAREIGVRTIESRPLEFENAGFRLSQVKPFAWRRNLDPRPLECKRTIFNYVATYNNFERRFAEFLDRAKDVRRFASLGTTEQGESGAQFRVDYLKPSGAIGFYHPDWVVVQSTPDGDVNWIIETKGRVWEGTEAKDEAISGWCTRVSKATGERWRFVRVNQSVFEASVATSLAALVTPARALFGS